VGNDRNWYVAMAKLDALAEELPPSIYEQTVAEFHEILDLFAAATGEDATPFRLRDDDLKPMIVSIQRGGRSGRPGRVSYGDKKQCDRNLFSRRLSAARKYFANLQPPQQARIS
jgi:hypothetical protein